MKIRSLEINGFRSLRDVKWRPGDLNLVIGPNASGKSNLLQALELLSVSARGGLSDHIRHAGGMEPLLFDGTTDGFRLRIETGGRRSTAGVGAGTAYFLRLVRIGQSSAFRIAVEDLTGPRPGGSSRKIGPVLFRRDGPNARVFDGNISPWIAPEGSVPEDETFLSVARGPFTPNPTTSTFGTQIAGWSVYQDFRTDRQASVRQPNLARYETRVSPDGSNLVSVLHTRYSSDREFQESVDVAMRVAFGDDYDRLVFPPAADGRVQLRLRWKSLKQEQSADQLSDGTLRFLFLLTALADPSPLLAVDEPETGLHPSMLPIIAEHARDAALRSQVILTTHSAAFLDAFTEFQPTVTVADREEGATALRVVDGEELDRWLQVYSLGRIYRSGTLEQMDPAA